MLRLRHICGRADDLIIAMPRNNLLSILGKLAAVASLLVALGASALWLRTYFVKDDILFARPRGSYQSFAIKTYPGTIDLAVLRMTLPIWEQPYWTVTRIGSADRQRSRKWDRENTVLGFGYLQTHFSGQHFIMKSNYSGYWSELYVPLWAVVVGAIAWPIIAIWRKFRRPHATTGRGFEVRSS